MRLSSRPSELGTKVSEEARALLAPYGRRQVFAAGEFLWREGEHTSMFVGIERGRVKLFRVLSNGNAITLYLFGPGDVIGFLPLLDGRPYPATARALDEVTAVVVSRGDLERAFQRDPNVALALVRLLATRLREAFDRIERSSVPEVLSRVAAALVALVPEDGAGPPPLVIDMPVRASEFAAAIGVVPESLSRALTKLVEGGALHRLAPRRFQVLDLSALHRAAAGAGV